MTSPILVTGATGNVGRHVVQGLLAAGRRVRALSRHAASAQQVALEHVVADLTQPASLTAALVGVRKVFLYARPEGIAGFIREAQRAGVEQVVLLSSSTVLAEQMEPSALSQQHLDVEQPLSASGITHTFLRPGPFAANALQWASAIRAGRIGLPYPDSYTTPIHERDIADIAVRALLEPSQAQRAYLLSGPAPLTAREQVALIAAAVGRNVSVETISPESWREQLRPFVPEDVIHALLSHQRRFDGVPSPVVAHTAELAGHPLRSFEAWAREHAGDFA